MSMLLKLVKNLFSNSKGVRNSARGFHLSSPHFNAEGNEVWKVIDFPWGSYKRENGEVIANGFGDIRIAGFNKFNGIKFIQEAVPSETKIWLEREPNNLHDENAIKVIGKASHKAKRINLGYIPRDLAEKISTNYTSNLPLMAEPRRAGIKVNKQVGFFSINILLPPSAARKKFKIHKP